jgi:hypothetical protein
MYISSSESAFFLHDSKFSYVPTTTDSFKVRGDSPVLALRKVANKGAAPDLVASKMSDN